MASNRSGLTTKTVFCNWFVELFFRLGLECKKIYGGEFGIYACMRKNIKMKIKIYIYIYKIYVFYERENELMSLNQQLRQPDTK